ncbi:hypothetical protein [Anaerosacchariphilus polymeriproducens]|uniref:Nucleotidyl transferase AbiEii/AbiGii toxin family protein n=1 Tax=Anaerosacchariphilus polymeriproducens TaxID=1812858 RepID=A0A371AWG8_9FIRM|nr:hypothetical protein [Anaerosacchariphilus polymeriproducens]RDU23879.1 hypothetical protein DWV06_07295 [Anaerosacchariphilus polymeriproducens]
MNDKDIVISLRKQSVSTSRKLPYTMQLFAQEFFLRHLSSRKKRDDFILTGLLSIYSRLEFPQKVSVPIEFQVKSQENLLEYVKEQLEMIVQENTNDISMKIDYIKKKQDHKHKFLIQAQVIAKIKHMKIPFIIKFFIIQDRVLKSKEFIYPSLIKKNDSFSVSSVRLETVVAECFIEVLENKEILDSLYEIFIIAKIAQNFSLNGRKVQDYLRTQKEKSEKWFLETDFKNLFHFEIEKQHQVKWKQFCNVEGENENDFLQVTEIVCSLLEPVWNALFQDIEFFGDWMPELKRYLG